MQRHIILAITILIITFTATGCYEQEMQPHHALLALQIAYNKGDVDAVLDCIDPSISKGVKAAINLLGNVVGVDIKDIIDMIPMLYILTENLEIEGQKIGDMKPIIDIELIDTEINADTAIVQTNVSMSSNGQTEKVGVRFFLIKNSEKWYIRNLEECEVFSPDKPHEN